MVDAPSPRRRPLTPPEATGAAQDSSVVETGWIAERLLPARPVLIGAAIVFAALTGVVGVPLVYSAAGYIAISAFAILRERNAIAPSAIRAREVARRVAEDRAQTLSAITDALPNAAFLLDGNGIVISQNESAIAISRAAEPGAHVSGILRMPAVLQALDQGLRTGEAVTVSYFERVPVNRWFQAHVAPLAFDSEADRRPRYVLLLLEDLTERQQVEKIRADFVANASHELRTPLASLLGFIETLQGNARNDPDAQARFLEIMREQAGRMSRLISDLMSLSRIEAAAHIMPEERIDLREVIGHVTDSLDMVAKQANVTIDPDLPDDLDLTVTGDRDELTQVFQNLIENAVKYGQAGGRVDIVARAVPGLSDAPAADRRFEITVRDYGEGIPAQHLPRLTERFYRVDVVSSREKGGTGLGLAIVKHILNRHRASLAIESEQGQGASFTVRIDGAASST